MIMPVTSTALQLQPAQSESALIRYRIRVGLPIFYGAAGVCPSRRTADRTHADFSGLRHICGAGSCK
jgi:hypothetical protein